MQQPSLVSPYLQLEREILPLGHQVAELLIELLPKHISVQILNAFLQNETSEHAARMAAMDNASKNCTELVESLTLVYNKARQAAITAELMDIVGGAEALKKA